MQIECCDFDILANCIINSNKRIVMFGAGVIGSVSAPEILSNLGVWQYVDCYIDNDSTKWGNLLEIKERLLEIKSPEYLQHCDEKTVIIINISRFAEVITQLNQIPTTEHMSCYLMPMLLIHNYCNGKSSGKPEMSAEAYIPKKIHYMWLGGKQIPDNLKICMESWRRYCPDYEIIEWNEHNYDMGKNIYIEQAYKAGAYGFVPDYARLDILYNEGGIYLDTDVELKKGLDEMLYQKAFCGVEKWQVLNFGGCSGAQKGNSMIKTFLDSRENICFLNEDGSLNKNTCGYYDTKTALQAGYRISGTTQCIGGMNIYAYDYFHPYDYMTGMLNETDNTRSIHHFNGGWLDEKMKNQNMKAISNYKKIYDNCMMNNMKES